MTYRKAVAEDAPLLSEIRQKQLIDEGSAPDAEIGGAITDYLARHLADGSLVEWLAEEDGAAVATAAILFLEFPPSFTNPTGVRGYVTNMYTTPSHRGRGVATAMLGRLTEEARKRGVSRLFLGASDMGRPVYERFGFRASEDNWMDLDLRREDGAD